MNIHLTAKAQREMEAIWKLEKEGLELLGVIAAEFRTDPLSIQCFDLRTVERVIEVVQELKALRKRQPFA